jgi:predicted transcriptional regulator
MARFQVQLAATRLQLVQTIVEVEASSLKEAEATADEMYCSHREANDLEWQRLEGVGAYDYVESAMVAEAREI